MGNVVTDVCARSNHDWLCINKALGIFLKTDIKKKNNNLHSDQGPFWVKSCFTVNLMLCKIRY